MMDLRCYLCGPVAFSEDERRRQLHQTMYDSFHCPKCNSMLTRPDGNRAVKQPLEDPAFLGIVSPPFPIE